MATRRFRSLAELGARARRSFPEADLARELQLAFRLRSGSLAAVKRGDTLELASDEKMVRFALQGMEGQILGWLLARGHKEIRRVTWSAE